MQGDEIGLLTRFEGAARRRLSVDEYYRMADAGILDPDERVELIEGEIVVMSPIHSPHFGAVNALTRLMVLAVGDRAVVSIQGPVRLDNHSLPEPDVAVLRPRPDDYRSAIPGPADVLLLIEVAASSLAFDRRVKKPLYARHGIPELWIVDIEAREIDICRAPIGDRYTEVTTARPGDVLAPVGLPCVQIPVAAVVG